MSSEKKRILLLDGGPAGTATEANILSAAGYEVFRIHPSPRAFQAALQSVPDLILLDYTYGDQLSAYFCKLCMGREELTGKPFILLSTRCEAVRELHRDVERITGVLPRPCPKETLLDAVERAVGSSPGSSALPPSASALQEKIRALARGKEPVGRDPASPSINKVSREISRWIGERICGGLPPGDASAQEPLALAVARSVLDPGALEALGREVCRIVETDRRRVFAASAKLISLSDLLQSFANSKLTGVLTVSGAGNRVEISLQEGDIRFLNPREIRMRFCQESLCFNQHSFSMDYIDATLRKCTAPDDSLLFHLLGDGMIPPERFGELMTSLGLEILRECLLDPESCWFEFLPMETLDRRFLDHSVDLPAQRFLLKLLSHLDEWKTVHQETEDGKVRYVAEPTAAEADLMSRSDDQITLLALLNRPCNLGELSPICQLSPFQAWRCIRRLQETGLVRKVEGAPVPTLPMEPAAC